MNPLETIKIPCLSDIAAAAAALENKNAVVNVPTRIGDNSCCLTSSGSGSPACASSRPPPPAAAAMIKKRSRPLFATGNSLPLENNMRQDVEWMMTNMG